MNPREFYVYIMSNKALTVLYTGVSNNLIRRGLEHKDKSNAKSFTSKYNINKLVYYETFDNVSEAVAREKQIKGYTRKKKEQLIKSTNPSWRNLSGDLV